MLHEREGAAEVRALAGDGVSFGRGISARLKNGEDKLTLAGPDGISEMMNCGVPRCLTEGRSRCSLCARRCRAAEAIPTRATYCGRRKILFACVRGNLLFDSTAALRAVEIHADAMLLAKNIDGVYDSDPAKNPAAKRLPHLTYDEVLAENLGVVDLAAAVLAKEHCVPALVFALSDPRNIRRVLAGEELGSRVD